MKEQPKLVLNKRTVAHLNNLEMRQVRGGDGEGDQSRGDCERDRELEKKSALKDAIKMMISQALKVC